MALQPYCSHCVGGGNQDVYFEGRDPVARRAAMKPPNRSPGRLRRADPIDDVRRIEGPGMHGPLIEGSTTTRREETPCRRLREAGIVTMLLLGLTGCAGVQQRLGWTEPPYRGDEDSDEHGLSRLAFWRRHRAEETSPADSAADSADPGRSTIDRRQRDAPADDAGDRPGLLRRLPLVGRLWKDDDRDDSDPMDIPALRYGQPAADPPAPARSRPRPARACRPDGGREVAPTPAAAPAPAESRPRRPTRRRGAEPLRELTVDLSGEKPQLDSAAVPAAHPGSPAAAMRSDASQVAPPSRPCRTPHPQVRIRPPPPAVPSRLPSSVDAVRHRPDRPTTSPPRPPPATTPPTAGGHRSRSPTVGAADQPASGIVDALDDGILPGPVWPIASGPLRGLGPELDHHVAAGDLRPGPLRRGDRREVQDPQALPVQEAQAAVFASSQYSPMPSARASPVREHLQHLQGQEALLPQDLAAPQVGLQAQELQGLQVLLVLRRVPVVRVRPERRLVAASGERRRPSAAAAQPGDVAEVRQFVHVVAADGLDEPPERELQVLGDLGVLVDDVVLVPAVLGLAVELRGPRLFRVGLDAGRPGARGGSGWRTPRRPCRGRRSRGPWSARRGSSESRSWPWSGGSSPSGGRPRAEAIVGSRSTVCTDRLVADAAVSAAGHPDDQRRVDQLLVEPGAEPPDEAVLAQRLALIAGEDEQGVVHPAHAAAGPRRARPASGRPA